MALWKFHCMEDKWPGLWQRWFLNQCVAIGWSPDRWALDGPNKSKQFLPGWNRARKTVQRIRPGDTVVVTLSHNRVARIGTVIALAIADDKWDPLILPTPNRPNGEMGRRILVRWDLTVGPSSRDSVTKLPENCRFSSGELRPTVCEVHSVTAARLRKAMLDEANWVGLWSHFKYEQALSGYIATYPHKLEDGLLPYPDERIRERVFPDQKRLDVLLVTKDGTPVIVECKQETPKIGDLEQLRGYMRSLQKETGKEPRGILVHGGSRNLTTAMARAARVRPQIDIVQYKLEVEFSGCA